MGVTEQIISENLTRFRLARGYSQARLAHMSGISVAAYQKIEKGQSVPRVDTLQNIASTLGLNLMDMVEQVPTLSGVRFRSQKKLKIRDEILVQVGRWLRDFNYLEKLLNDKAPYVFGDLSERVSQQVSIDDHDRVRKAAREAREAAELDIEEPILDICGLLESKGVKILPLSKASTEFFGLAVGTADGGPAVIVNTWDRIPVERWIFSACHELGHLILHLESFIVKDENENPKEEYEANIFASHFLMPDDAFAKYLKQSRGLSLVDRVLKIKRIFGVSYKTVLMRLLENGLTDNSIWGRFQSQYQRQYGRTLKLKEEPKGIHSDQFARSLSPAEECSKEPSKLDRSDFMADRLRGLVRNALEEDKITVSRAAEILGLDITSMKAEVAAWNCDIDGKLVA
ncbi:MAG: XRE family transcriptional regulator [Deltaproteobacteria bacterium]|nr:XRE family transcriptional regulator [Deltaproteobacteria bacterium]